MMLDGRDVELVYQARVVQYGASQLNKSRYQGFYGFDNSRVLGGSNQVRAQVSSERLASESKQAFHAQLIHQLHRIRSELLVGCKELVEVVHSRARAVALYACVLAACRLGVV